MTDERAPIDDSERAPMSSGERHRTVDGEIPLTLHEQWAPISDEWAPTDDSERALMPFGERHRNVNGESALATDVNRERALVGGGEWACTRVRARNPDRADLQLKAGWRRRPTR